MARLMAEPAPPRSVRDAVMAWRDRLVASPRFQRWASAFPLTRPFARHSTRALFDLCAGFVYSQILLACVRLKLFDILFEGPQTVDRLAGRLGLTPEATRRLLVAATALGLTARRSGDRYGLGELGAAMVGNPAVARMVEHHTMLYADLRDPVALLRGEAPDTELGRYWPYTGNESAAGLSPEQVAAYSTLMSASQPLIAEDVLDAYRLDRHRHLMDVGGGEGTFVATVAARHPALRLTLFDLPAVAERARARFAEARIGDRAQAVGGSFLSDPLPSGADVISLLRVVHDHDDDAVMTLLRAVRAALPGDGVLLLAEPMSGTAGAEPIGDAYFGFYLLAMGRGRARTPEELTALLTAAGFANTRVLPARRPLLARLIVARPG